jgi:hypothetical protein
MRQSTPSVVFVRNPADSGTRLSRGARRSCRFRTLYRSGIGVALGPIKARFNIVVEITEELAPNRLLCITKGDEGSKASMITATSEIKLEAQEAGRTEISCPSEVPIAGRLGKFGQRSTRLS